ncbi:MAG TPA: hypothetical protein VNG12_12065 [Acidimicrobiales bacterium]|nr:hypothetical protein [Acidimicrobiales bacterium]
MANTLPVPDVDTADTKQSWFTRPLSTSWCVVGYIVATGVFMACIAIPGGPAVGDAFEIIYPTWAVAHGQFACMYPPHPASVPSYASPVFPLINGAVGFVTQIGHGATFPTGPALGHNCNNAIDAMVRWSQKTGAVFPTLWSACVGWLVLMGGLLSVLRASGRGRTGWEPATLVLVACLPPLWMSIEMYAHPQDIVAMGFSLAALGFALRSRWIGSGVFTALAVLAQPFGILVAIPLFVVAPAAQKLRYVTGAVVGVVVIDLPLLLLTSGSAAHTIFLGSGNAVGRGTTVLWEIHLPSTLLVQVSRIAPLVACFLVAWLVQRRLGSAALQPPALVSLVAVCLSLRLVFEDNLFSYYFLALAVILVVVDVVHGHLRQTVIAWLIMVSLVYSEPVIFVWRHSWDENVRHWLPVIVMIVALLLIMRDVLRHAAGWNTFMWIATVITTLVVWPLSNDPFNRHPSQWVWQVVLVSIGVVLAVTPLWTIIRGQATPSPVETPDPAEVPSIA